MRNIINILSGIPLVVSGCISQNVYTRLNLADKANKTEDASYYTWGGSVVKYGNTYYFALCRWTTSGDFLDWPLNSRIVIGTSSSLDGGYTGFTEITETRGDTWCQTSAVNPRLYKYGDAYYLFYTGLNGVTNEEAIASQQIGVVYTYDFVTWYKGNNPILSPRPTEWDAYYVNNPAVYQSTDGNFSMIYKSREDLGSVFKLGIAQSTTLTGKWASITDAPILNSKQLEDPTVWYEGCKYYMIARGFVGSENGILYESTDGIIWTESANALAFDKKIYWTDLTNDTYTRLEGPYIYREGNTAKALFTCCYNGSNSFNICRLLSNI